MAAFLASAMAILQAGNSPKIEDFKMSNQALIRQNAESKEVELKEAMTIGDMAAKSGMFPDITTQARAVMSILAGAELGIPPMASLRGIHIIKGKAELAAGLIAAMIKDSGRYDYEITKHDDQECELEWFEVKNGVRVISIGKSKFTMKDAARAKLIKPDSGWEKFPRAMLFARAITEGQRLYIPHLGIGSLYSPGEVSEIADVTPEPVIVDSATGPIYDKIGELLRAQKLEDSSGARRFVLDGIFRGAYQAVGLYLNISPEIIRDLAKKAGVINPQAQAHSEIQDDLTAVQEKIADLQNQRKQEPQRTPDPTPGLAPTLTAAQQKVSDAGMSAWKEHGKDKATVLHLISQYIGRPVKRSADLTDEEAEKVFGYLQACATQWSAEKEQNNQVIKYDPKNRAHGAAAGKELDRLVLKFAMLGMKTPDLEQLIAGLAYNELGREIENRFALNNEECAAMNELLKAEIAKLEAQKAAEQAKQQILELAAEENAPDFG